MDLVENSHSNQMDWTLVSMGPPTHSRLKQQTQQTARQLLGPLLLKLLTRVKQL